jgi:hypothetical protein
LHIAPLLVLPAERHAAVWTGVLFHLSTSTLGGGNTEQVKAVGHHVQLNYWHFRRQSLPPTMSLEAQSSALAGRFQRFGTALFDTAMECARDGGQFAGWELTGAAGLSEDESHGPIVSR